ncbi:MAG: hypothetical protein HYZ34_01195 [Ignavibacteriae bacterium]|nr:hypothetical protein [Ignavibacteriota bacterium]
MKNEFVFIVEPFYIYPTQTIQLPMTSQQILSELKNLSAPERMLIAEEALHLTRNEISGTKGNKKNELVVAAESLLSDYANDAELTSFTSLDGEEFRA